MRQWSLLVATVLLVAPSAPGADAPKPLAGALRGRAGGAEGTEQAVRAGLDWLAAHQDSDGRWDCDDFMKHDPPTDVCDGPGGSPYDTGVSGLALLSFLGAGCTDRGADTGNPYADCVRKGLHFLVTAQAKEGWFGGRSVPHAMYGQAIATLALCKAYGLTHDAIYRKAAQAGLDCLCDARNPGLAWRYTPRCGENDTCVTGWCVMALASGRSAGLHADAQAFQGAKAWLDKVTAPDGSVGYRKVAQGPFRTGEAKAKFPADRSRSTTAIGVYCRLLLGETPQKSAAVRNGAARIQECPPAWDVPHGSIDLFSWYFGTLALHRIGTSPWGRWNKALTQWERWNKSMKEAVVEHQHVKADGARGGSWDPIGVWGADGGRVYSTALLTLTLEVYYPRDQSSG